MQPLHGKVGPSATTIQRLPAGLEFEARHSAVVVRFGARLNTVVAMAPFRISVTLPAVRTPGVESGSEAAGGGRRGRDGPGGGPAAGRRAVWALTLAAVRESSEPPLAAAVTARLRELQRELAARNNEAWSRDETQDAWTARFGAPEAAASRIVADPALRLAPLHLHLGDLRGKRVTNLMGSNGTKAVAMALLGASRVTVVDVSPGNAAWGMRLAAEAGVGDAVGYVTGDVLELSDDQVEAAGGADVVVMELGVLHYFVDLQPLFALAHRMLRPASGARMVLRDFHPISTKLLAKPGNSKKWKLAGNYFDADLSPSAVAYSKHEARAGVDRGDDGSGSGIGSDGEGGRAAVRGGAVATLLRRWTVGEVVTAAAGAGLVVKRLEEEAGVRMDDSGIPKLFTLVAERL